MSEQQLDRHPWCRDLSRDEAVRASDDGRSVPLPTLEEAIARAFGFDEASVQRSCDETKTWPADIQAKAKETLADLLEQCFPRLQALAEASRWGKRLFEARYPEMMPKTGSPSSAVEHENKGDDMGTKAKAQAAAHRPEAAGRITQALTADRFSAAVAEADRLRVRVAQLEAERDGLNVDLRALMDVGHRLGSQVASLESQLEAVADRAAAEETALESAPAASAAAGTEVVAWGVRMKSGRYKHFLFDSEEAAQKCAELITDDTVPLYAAQQPAKGWLTPEEREAIMYLIANRSQFAPQTPYEERRNAASRACHDILARSSPPKVVRPGKPLTFRYGDDATLNRDGQWLEALADAGVPWKEVVNTPESPVSSQQTPRKPELPTC